MHIPFSSHVNVLISVNHFTNLMGPNNEDFDFLGMQSVGRIIGITNKLILFTLTNMKMANKWLPLTRSPLVAALDG